MRISIIVPVYQVEQYLDRCIESIVNQSYRELEIILIDDGSIDSSGAKCDQWANIDNRIQVFHKRNGGLSDARNYGLKKATGEYVLFVDSDDFIEKDSCERFIKCLGQSGADVIVGNAIIEQENDCLSLLMRTYPEENLKIFDGKSFLLKRLHENNISKAVWLYLYRRDFLINNDLNFKVGILHEDEQFTPRALLKAKLLLTMNYPFYHYVIRANSITQTPNYNKRANDMLDTIDELSEIYSTECNLDLRKYLYNSLCNLYLYVFCEYHLLDNSSHKPRKKMVWKYAGTFRNRFKALLFSISPKMYSQIHLHLKRG